MTFRPSRLATALFALAGVLLLAPAPAGADAVLVATSPADQSIVGGTVGEIQIVFNELVTEGSITITGPDGPVPTLDQTGSGQVISAQFVALSVEGRYSVIYSVVSADADPVSGSLGFTYAADGPAILPVSVPALDTGPRPLVVGLVVIGLAGLAILGGQTYLRTRRLRELSRWDGLPSDR